MPVSGSALPAVGLNDAVDVFAHRETGSHADDEGRVGDVDPDVPFGERGLDDHFGAELGDGDALRVDHDRDAARVPERGDFFRAGGYGRRNAFHRAEPFIDGFGKGHPAPDGHRMRRFQNDQVAETGTIESERNAGGDVPTATEKDGEPLVLVHVATPAAGRKCFRPIYTQWHDDTTRPCVPVVTIRRGACRFRAEPVPSGIGGLLCPCPPCVRWASFFPGRCHAAARGSRWRRTFHHDGRARGTRGEERIPGRRGLVEELIVSSARRKAACGPAGGRGWRPPPRRTGRLRRRRRSASPCPRRGSRRRDGR